MIRLLIAMTCCAALITGCNITRERAQEIKTTSGTVGEFFGIPRPVGEGIAGLALAGICSIGGHKHGRHRERKTQAKRVMPKIDGAGVA